MEAGKAFESLLAFVEERLRKSHSPDPELVKAHNADPLNKDWQIPEDQPWEQSDVVHDLLAFLAEQMIVLNKQKQVKIKEFLEWLEAELQVEPDAKGNTGLEALSDKTRLKNYLGDYQKGEEHLSFEEFWKILKKNERRIRTKLSPKFRSRLEEYYAANLAELLPLKRELALTDKLIDQIVYKLYGLTEEEIKIVERLPAEEDEPDLNQADSEA
jgi:hypothetical protein